MLKEVLEEYLKLFPQDRAKLGILLDLIDSGEPLDRSNSTGHITGGAIIFSPDLSRVLLVHHKILSIWLQPGGHWEVNEDGPWLTAVREASEETGVRIARRINICPADERVPVAVESHKIPANPAKNEPEHYHHDFKYGFVAKNTELSVQADEVRSIKWSELEGLRVENIRAAISRLKPLLKA